MKYRGGNYNIGISVYFQAMFIECKVFTRDMWLEEILRKFMKRLFFGLQQHLISSENACLQEIKENIEEVISHLTE